MHSDQSTLAAMIGSRICHDLISPIGAISNGLELVALSGALQDGPEMSLIQQSCDNAAARIRFFRIAFGSALDHRLIPSGEARATLEEHYAGTRFRVRWEAESDLPRSVVQLAYLAVLCLETALPQGGEIAVSAQGMDISVQAVGSALRQDGVPWALLSSDMLGEEVELGPANVQFGLISVLFQEAGIAPTINIAGTAASMSFTYPALPTA